jgi:hypothetical protein
MSKSNYPKSEPTTKPFMLRTATGSVLDGRICLRWPNYPRRFLEIWVNDFAEGEQGIFLRLSEGFPVGAIQQAYSEALERLGKVAKHPDKFRTSLNRWNELQQEKLWWLSRRRKERDIKRLTEIARLQKQLDDGLQMAHVKAVATERGKDLSNANQPTTHKRLFKYPAAQIRSIIKRGQQERRDHNSSEEGRVVTYSWGAIAENIHGDVSDEADENSHKGWKRCATKTITDILRKQKAYLKEHSK